MAEFQGQDAGLTERIIATFYQVFNELGYLRSSTVEVGFVLGFGQRAKFKRVVVSNNRKQNRDADQKDRSK